jgi:hypothetical protein
VTWSDGCGFHHFPTHATVEDLQALIAKGDDAAGPHLIWIHRCGDVYFHTIKPPRRIGEFRECANSMGGVYLFEPLAPGGGWVGPKAATDPAWMAELHAHLVQGWSLYQQACATPGEPVAEA